MQATVKLNLAWVSLLITFLAPSAAMASGFTPNHVYQVVDKINSDLDLMHEENESSPIARSYSTSNRKPRHVIQKAREVFLRVQKLKELNGLATRQVPPFPLTEIQPADVKNIVDQIAVDVAELREEFGVDAAAAMSALPSGKTPSDVYMHLQKVNSSLDGFDLPPIVPNDVYQVASTIRNELVLISNENGLDQLDLEDTPVQGKTPANVYQSAEGLLKIIADTCAANTKYCPKGGVQMPAKPNGNIKPENVLDILNNVLAELGSIKAGQGITVTTPLAPSASGMTPNNVYEVLAGAKTLAQNLK